MLIMVFLKNPYFDAWYIFGFISLLYVLYVLYVHKFILFIVMVLNKKKIASGCINVFNIKEDE